MLTVSQVDIVCPVHYRHSQTLPCSTAWQSFTQPNGKPLWLWFISLGSQRLPAASLFELLLQPLCIHVLRSEKLCQEHMMVFPAWFLLPRSMHLMLQFCVRWCCLWKAHLMHQNPSQVWTHPSCTKQAESWICKVVSLRVLESTWEYGSRSPWSKCHCVHRGPSRCQGSEDAHRGAGGSNDFRWCRCLRPLSVSLKPPASATADIWGVGTSCHSGLHRLEDTEAKNSSSLCERQLHSCNVRSVEKTTQSVVLKF